MKKRTLVATSRINQQIVADNPKHQFVATVEGFSFFCGETPEHALKRLNDHVRPSGEITLWKIPRDVAVVVQDDGRLVADQGYAEVVDWPKPKAAKGRKR